ncbi:MAG TPA: hypothetical protein VMJ10_00830, partial [Kofleriaceae bacterium]|nr:hypothetical protein [Kofleriaceae bacterium]
TADEIALLVVSQHVEDAHLCSEEAIELRAGAAEEPIRTWMLPAPKVPRGDWRRTIGERTAAESLQLELDALDLARQILAIVTGELAGEAAEVAWKPSGRSVLVYDRERDELLRERLAEICRRDGGKSGE